MEKTPKDEALTDVTIFEAKKLPGGINNLLLKTEDAALSIKGKKRTYLSGTSISKIPLPGPGHPTNKKSLEPDEITSMLKNIGKINICKIFNETLNGKDKPINSDGAVEIFSHWVQQAKTKTA